MTDRVSTRSLTAFLLAVLGLSFTSLPARLGAVGAFVAELALVLAGAALALRLARPWLRAASRPTLLRLLSAILLAMSVGQLVRSKKAFPLMPYTMYGRAAEGDVTFYEYRALHRSGARARFRPSNVIATLGRARIVKGLARELDAMAALESRGADAKRERARAEEMLRILMAVHNRTQRDPVTEVEVLRVVVPPPYEPEMAERRTVLAVKGAP